MPSININGVVHALKRTFSVKNSRIIVDGNDVTPSDKVVHIAIQGDVENIEVDACQTVTISGNAKTVRTGSGDVRCGSVLGPVQTGSGDVTCGDVGGSVSTGAGDVTCKSIGGNARTGSGDISIG